MPEISREKEQELKCEEIGLSRMERKPQSLNNITTSLHTSTYKKMRKQQKLMGLLSCPHTDTPGQTGMGSLDFPHRSKLEHAPP